MSNLKKVIEHIVKNAQLSEDPEVQAILSNEALEGISIPTEQYNKMIASALSYNAAINNPDVKKHFNTSIRGTIFNKADAQLKKKLAELGIEDDKITEVLDMEDYFDRIPKAIELIQSVKKGAEGADDNEGRKKADAEKAALINELRAKLKEQETLLKNDFVPKAELEQLNQKIKQEKYNNFLHAKALELSIAPTFESSKAGVLELIKSNISKKYPIIEFDEAGNAIVKNPQDPSLQATDEKGTLLTFNEILEREAFQFLAKKEDVKAPTTIVTQLGLNPLSSSAQKSLQKVEELKAKFGL